MKETLGPPRIIKQMPTRPMSPAFYGGIEGYVGAVKLEATAVRNKTRAIANVIEGTRTGVWSKLGAIGKVADILSEDSEQYYCFPPKGEFKLVP